MPRFVVSQAAERDIESILIWTHDTFGAAACLRYEALLRQAFEDLAETPDRAGSHGFPEIALGVRTYHLRHSKRRLKKSVHNPRHILLYRVAHDGAVQIGRVLHDRMDLIRHVPDEYLVDSDPSPD